MNILIIGSGGREHAIAWKLKQSAKVENIFVAPGNAGTLDIAINIPLSKTEDIIEWIKDKSIGLVIVGPDSYLAEGIVDILEDLNIKVFGPTKSASEIEWSKVFAKNFMIENNIPTARYKVFNNIEHARAYIQNENFPLVIKADGLAFGKGVVIADTLEQTESALKEIMEDKVFGEAGNEIIVEEYLQGTEISTHAFCDGNTAVMFPSAKDHKRIYENDKGPNTGGMGTVAPLSKVTDEQLEEIRQKIVIPVLEGLKNKGSIFKGILFPGIMLTESGPKVIEFNARFGDPETQSYMRLLETDLVDILLSCVDGTLLQQEIKWSTKSACCIVLASGGYPGDYKTGEIINGLPYKGDDDVVIFHAGTKLDNENVVTNGGRVLNITATADSLPLALEKAYKAIPTISFSGMQYRKDIGEK